MSITPMRPTIVPAVVATITSPIELFSRVVSTIPLEFILANAFLVPTTAMNCPIRGPACRHAPIIARYFPEFGLCVSIRLLRGLYFGGERLVLPPGHGRVVGVEIEERLPVGSDYLFASLRL